MTNLFLFLLSWCNFSSRQFSLHSFLLLDHTIIKIKFEGSVVTYPPLLIMVFFHFLRVKTCWVDLLYWGFGSRDLSNFKNWTSVKAPLKSEIQYSSKPAYEIDPGPCHRRRRTHCVGTRSPSLGTTDIHLLCQGCQNTTRNIPLRWKSVKIVTCTLNPRSTVGIRIQ